MKFSIKAGVLTHLGRVSLMLFYVISSLKRSTFLPTHLLNFKKYYFEAITYLTCDGTRGSVSLSLQFASACRMILVTERSWPKIVLWHVFMWWTCQMLRTVPARAWLKCLGIWISNYCWIIAVTRSWILTLILTSHYDIDSICNLCS